jgi:diadenosine tetraphosphate (Ap4A) HIT family hydrolase
VPRAGLTTGSSPRQRRWPTRWRRAGSPWLSRRPPRCAPTVAVRACRQPRLPPAPHHDARQERTGRRARPCRHVSVVARRHVNEPYELPEPDQHLLWVDSMRVAAAVASVGSPIKMNDEIHCNTLPHRHPHLCPRHLDDPIVGGPSIRGWPLFVGNPEELLAIAAAIKARRRVGAAVPDVAARPSPSFEDRDAPDAFCASRLRHNEATGSCPIPADWRPNPRAKSRTVRRGELPRALPKASVGVQVAATGRSTPTTPFTRCFGKNGGGSSRCWSYPHGLSRAKRALPCRRGESNRNPTSRHRRRIPRRRGVILRREEGRHQ